MTFPPNSEFTIKRNAHLDPFGRVRVSTPTLSLSTLFNFSDRTAFWTGTTATGGTATWNSTSGCIDMTVTTSSGSRVVRQTKEYFDYRAGQGQVSIETFAMNAAKANLTQRVGYFDDTEGFYLEQAGLSAPTVNIRSNVTGSLTYETASQADWNIDTLLGTGGARNPSGINLALANNQIFVVDFQWLGVGTVRYGFNIGGSTIYVHEFNHSNTSNGSAGLPYVKSPKLPVRYEIVNTGVTASSSTLRQICASVMHEGAADAPGLERTVWTAPDSSATSSTTMQGYLGIRLASGFRRCSLQATDVNIFNNATGHMVWALILNPAYTGTPSWVAVPGTDSIAEMSRTQVTITVSATAGIVGMPTSGIVIGGGVIPGGGNGTRNASSSYHDYIMKAVADYAGTTSDEIWLCAGISTGTGTVMGSLTYRENR